MTLDLETARPYEYHMLLQGALAPSSIPPMLAFANGVFLARISRTRQEKLSFLLTGTLSLAPGFKNGDDNHSQQSKDVKKNANEQQATIGKVDWIRESVETLACAQRDELFIPANSEKVYRDAENAHYLLHINPIKSEQSPLRQRSKQNTSE